MTWQLALIIGCFQVMALIPGTSRSGATLTAGLLLGFSRSDAARFSFLLSVPVIFLSGLLEGVKLMGVEQVPWGSILAGRSEEHTSELQSRGHLVCRLLLENKKA